MTKRLPIVKNPEEFDVLSKWLTPIINKFSFKPDKGFARYEFGEFNGEKIWYYAINGEMCFTSLEFSKYLKIKVKTVKNKVSDKIKNYSFVEGTHYITIRDGVNSPENRDNLRGVSSSNFITFLGIWELLPTFRGEIPHSLFSWFGVKLYNLIKKNLLIKGEFFIINKKRKLIPQIFGDPRHSYIDRKGYLYASRGELLIAQLLYNMNHLFQYNAPIILPKHIKEEITKKFNMSYTWSYITADYLIRTEPKTVIEYWGRENDSKYNWKRKIKEHIYEMLNIKVIPIESYEPQQILLLKEKLTNSIKDT